MICQQELKPEEKKQLELCTFNIHIHLELLKIVYDEVKVQKDIDLIQDLLNPVQEETKNNSEDVMEDQQS